MTNDEKTILLNLLQATSLLVTNMAEMRRDNLRLAVEMFGGDVDKLCAVANVSYAYLSQIKTMQPDTKIGFFAALFRSCGMPFNIFTKLFNLI